MTDPSTPQSPSIAPEVLARRRIFIKVGTIAALALVLLIPLALLAPVVEERATTRDGAVTEIERDWGLPQDIIGPVLVIPTVRGPAFALPDALHVDAALEPEQRSRGIYHAIVYAANLDIAGAFHRPSPAELGIASELVHWDQAYLAIADLDLRGTGTQVALHWATASVAMLPGSSLQPWPSGLHAAVALPEGPIQFSLTVPLHGSEGVRFAPLGVRNDISVRSTWPDPRFTGAFLPARRSVAGDGFTAAWSVSYYGRDFGQTSLGNLPNIASTLFGVDLLPGIDSYRCVDRAIRYGVLFVVLAFISFFLFEIVARVRIHPFQYAMVGLALGVFFLILLALSELVPFLAAYSTAAAGTIGLVVMYMVPVLKAGRRTAIAAALLGASFAILYVVLEAEDYALLAGSLVVFAALAVTMRLTRALDWYAEEELPRPASPAPAAPPVAPGT